MNSNQQMSYFMIFPPCFQNMNKSGFVDIVHKSIFVFNSRRRGSAEVIACADGALHLNQSQFIAGFRLLQCFVQLIERVDGNGVRIAAGFCDCDKIDLCRHGGHAADGFVRAVVNHDMDQVVRFVRPDERHGSHVHQDSTVAIDAPDPVLRLVQRHAQGD